MTVQSSAIHASGAELQSPVKAPFARLFAIGVGGWIIATVVTFIISLLTAHPDSFASAFMWTISRWWIGFAIGLLLMAGYGLARKLTVGWAVVAYALPVLILAAFASICLAVYPDNGFRIEFGTYLPLVIIFYLLGLLWVFLSRDSGDRPSFARAVLPAMVGGLMILGFVAVPVFTGDAFRYRNAFNFTITKATVVNGEIHTEGSVEIRKAGNYAFVSPRYSFAEYLAPGNMESGLDVGTITWGSAGAPPAGKTGVFPLRIVWQKGVLPASMTTLPEYQNEVSIDVCDAGDSNRGIYFLAAPLMNQ